MGDVEQSAWRHVCARRDRRPIYIWAKENVYLNPPFTKTGWFDVTESRHFIPVFDALQDDYVREVNLCKPTRSGGTTIADVYIPWTFRNDPGPGMHSLQADDVADEHANSRSLPTWRSCLGVKDLIPAGRINTAETRLLNGYKFYINGPSLANFQTKGLRFLILDEPWMYKRGAMEQARARVGDYVKLGTSKIFCLSQGGEPDSDWDFQFNSGEVGDWSIECAGCHKHFIGELWGTREDGSFWGLKWDKHRLPNGDWHLSKVLPTVRYECPLCEQRHPHIDTSKTKSEWNRTGLYQRTSAEENRKKKSFRWTNIIDYPWVELVELWLTACNHARRGVFEHKIDFLRKKAAKMANLQTILESGSNLKRVVYDIKTKRTEEHFRTLSIDKQKEGFYWWMARGWSKDGKTWRIAFGNAQGVAELEEIRIKHEVAPNHTSIDSAFEPLGDRGVYAACIRYGWIAVRGDKRNNFVHQQNKGRVLRPYSPLERGDPERGQAGEGRRFAPLIIFSKERFNMRVQYLIDNGLWEEPPCDDSEMEKEYNRQMAQRVRVHARNKKTNAREDYFKEGKDDHAKDLANQSTLMATLKECLPVELDDLDKPAKGEDSAAVKSE
jgi:hypothetical protein